MTTSCGLQNFNTENGLDFRKRVLTRGFVKIIVVEESQEKNAGCPIRGAGIQNSFRFKRYSGPMIDPEGPCGGIIYDTLNVESRMVGILFEPCQRFGDLFPHGFIGAEFLQIFEEFLTGYENGHHPCP